MYKILIKATSKVGEYYSFYRVDETDDTGAVKSKVFETDDQAVLEAKMIELYKDYPTSNVVVVQDVTTTIDIVFN